MNKNKKIVLISIYCALAIVLDYIKAFIPFLNMPLGGSINIALIPVVLCSFHLGIFYGMMCGLLWWLVSSLLGLNPFFLSFAQYVIDYILPSAIVGISSIFYKNKKVFEIELGIIIMMILRTLLLVISGAIYWPSGVASNSIEAWIASLSYNIPYCAATLIMLLIVMPLLVRSMRKYML